MNASPAAGILARPLSRRHRTVGVILADAPLRSTAAPLEVLVAAPAVTTGVSCGCRRRRHRPCCAHGGRTQRRARPRPKVLQKKVQRSPSRKNRKVDSIEPNKQKTCVSGGVRWGTHKPTYPHSHHPPGTCSCLTLCGESCAATWWASINTHLPMLSSVSVQQHVTRPKTEGSRLR